VERHGWRIATAQAELPDVVVGVIRLAKALIGAQVEAKRIA
jgi:hypothetical protein